MNDFNNIPEENTITSTQDMTDSLKKPHLHLSPLEIIGEDKSFEHSSNATAEEMNVSVIKNQDSSHFGPFGLIITQAKNAGKNLFMISSPHITRFLHYFGKKVFLVGSEMAGFVGGYFENKKSEPEELKEIPDDYIFVEKKENNIIEYISLTNRIFGRSYMIDCVV